MAELRQNVITREWVIISPERARRPGPFIRNKHESPEAPISFSDCPFCVGNEDLTLKETLRISAGDIWKVRVVPNKFPALKNEGDRIGRDPLRETVKKVNKVEVNSRGELHHARRTQEIHTRVQSECSAGV